MKRPTILISPFLFSIGLACVGISACAQEPVGLTPGTAVVTQDTAVGWSVKKSLLGKVVYNEKNEKIGVIHDLLIGPDSTISHVIVAAGGFVGKGRHDVAIETGSLQVRDGKFFVEGATRENVKATPNFEYASRI